MALSYRPPKILILIPQVIIIWKRNIATKKMLLFWRNAIWKEKFSDKFHIFHMSWFIRCSWLVVYCHLLLAVFHWGKWLIRSCFRRMWEREREEQQLLLIPVSQLYHLGPVERQNLLHVNSGNQMSDRKRESSHGKECIQGRGPNLAITSWHGTK